jgi:hypothetical protein
MIYMKFLRNISCNFCMTSESWSEKCWCFLSRRVHAHNQWPCRKSHHLGQRAFVSVDLGQKGLKYHPNGYKKIGSFRQIPIYKLGTYNIFLCSNFSAIYRFYVEQNITYNPWKAQATKAFLAISWVVGYMIPC